jgi:hypothetical protein
VTNLRYATDATADGVVVRDGFTGRSVGAPHPDIAAANQAACEREEREFTEDLAREVEGAGSVAAASEVRRSVPLPTVLLQLRRRGDGTGEAAAIVAEAIQSGRGATP